MRTLSDELPESDIRSAPLPRERKILKAAAELFHERGFGGVSVDAIGQRAGASGPAIYRHFRSKDEILVSIFEEALDGLMEATAIKEDDPQLRLRALVRSHAEYVLRESEYASIWANESTALPLASRRRFLRRTRTYFERWSHAVQACYPHRGAHELEVTVMSAISLVNVLTQWPAHLRAHDDSVDIVTDMAIAAIGAADRS